MTNLIAVFAVTSECFVLFDQVSYLFVGTTQETIQPIITSTVKCHKLGFKPEVTMHRVSNRYK